MATLIDDNDVDGQLGKSIWWLLSIRCTSFRCISDSSYHCCVFFADQSRKYNHYKFFVSEAGNWNVTGDWFKQKTTHQNALL